MVSAAARASRPKNAVRWATRPRAVLWDRNCRNLVVLEVGVEMLALSEDEAQRATEQASRSSTMKIIVVDPKAPQADDDSEEGS